MGGWMRMDGFGGGGEKESWGGCPVRGGAMKWLVGAYISGLGQFRTRKKNERQRV